MSLNINKRGEYSNKNNKNIFLRTEKCKIKKKIKMKLKIIFVTKNNNSNFIIKLKKLFLLKQEI